MKKRSFILDIIGAVNEYKKDKINIDNYKQSLSTNTQGEGISTQSTSNHNLSQKIKVSNINLKENSIKLAPYNTKKIKKIPYKVTSLNYGGGSVKNSVPLLNIKTKTAESFLKKNKTKSNDLLRAEIMVDDQLKGTKNIDLYDQFIKETKLDNKNFLIVKYMFEDYVDKKNGNTNPVSDPLLQQKVDELNKNHEQFRKEKLSEIKNLTTSNKDNSKKITELNDVIKKERDTFLKEKEELNRQIKILQRQQQQQQQDLTIQQQQQQQDLTIQQQQQNEKEELNRQIQNLQRQQKQQQKQQQQEKEELNKQIQNLQRQQQQKQQQDYKIQQQQQKEKEELTKNLENQHKLEKKQLEEKHNMKIEKLQTIQKEEITKHTKNIESLNKKILNAEIEKETANKKVQSIDKDVKEISKTLQENLDILSNLSGKPIQQGGSNILYQIDLTTFKTELKRQENNKYIGILKQLYDTLNGIKEQQEAEEKVAATTSSEEKRKSEETIKKLKEKLKKLNEEKERRKQEEEEQRRKQREEEQARRKREQEEQLRKQREEEQLRKQQEEERKREQLKKQQEEERKREQLKKQQEEERKREQLKKQQEERKREQLRKQQEEQARRKKEQEEQLRKQQEDNNRLKEKDKEFRSAADNIWNNYKSNETGRMLNQILDYVDENVVRKQNVSEKLEVYQYGIIQLNKLEEQLRKQREASPRSRKIWLAKIDKRGKLKYYTDATRATFPRGTPNAGQVIQFNKDYSFYEIAPRGTNEEKWVSNNVKNADSALRILSKMAQQQRGSPVSSPVSSPRGVGNICPGKQEMLKAFDNVINYGYTADHLVNNLERFKQFAAHGRPSRNKKQKSVLQWYRDIVKEKGINKLSCNHRRRQRIRREIEYIFNRFWTSTLNVGAGQDGFKRDIKKMMKELLDSISQTSAEIDNVTLDKLYQRHNNDSHFEGTIEESDSSDLISESSNLITINNSSIEQQGGKRKLKGNDKVNKMKYQLYQKLVSKNLI